MKTIEELFRHNVGRAHDINEHLPYLAGLAMNRSVTELGFRTGRSTSAFLFGGATMVFACDLHSCTEAVATFDRLVGPRFKFTQASSLKVPVRRTDILFVDSYHSGTLLRQELRRFCDTTALAIVMHDTETFGHKGEGGGEGLQAAVRDFEKEHPEWNRKIHFPNNNGLTVLLHKRRWLR